MSSNATPLPYPCYEPIFRSFPINTRIHFARSIAGFRTAERNIPQEFEEIIAENGCFLKMRWATGYVSVSLFPGNGTTRVQEAQGKRKPHKEYPKLLFNNNFALPVDVVKEKVFDYYLKRPNIVTKILRVSGPESEYVLRYPITVTEALDCVHMPDYEKTFEFRAPTVRYNAYFKVELIQHILEKFESEKKAIGTEVELSMENETMNGMLTRLTQLLKVKMAVLRENPTTRCVLYPMEHAEIVIWTLPADQQPNYWPGLPGPPDGQNRMIFLKTKYLLQVVPHHTAQVFTRDVESWNSMGTRTRSGLR